MEVDYTKQNLGQRERKIELLCYGETGIFIGGRIRYFKTARPSIMSLKKKEKDQEYE